MQIYLNPSASWYYIDHIGISAIKDSILEGGAGWDPG